MLSFFFNRFSRMVLAMEVVGLLLFAIAAVRIWGGNASLLARILFATVLIEYAFIRFCTTRRWYRGVPRFSGIELQFKKALVPTSYILAIIGLLLLPFPSAVPLAVAALLLAVVAHVNVILLYFHASDRDPTPVNFYSSGAFLGRPDFDADQSRQ